MGVGHLMGDFYGDFFGAKGRAIKNTKRKYQKRKYCSRCTNRIYDTSSNSSLCVNCRNNDLISSGY